MLDNRFFDWRRFRLVCRKEWVESWKFNMRFLIGCYAALLVILFLSRGLDFKLASTSFALFSFRAEIVDSNAADLRWLRLFEWTYMAAALIYVTSFMAPLKEKAGRIRYLTLPASDFEKYLSRWLMYTVGFTLAYLLVFKLADWTLVLLSLLTSPDHSLVSVSLSGSLGRIGQGSFALASLVGLGSLMLSLMMLGSTLWPKHTAGKTLAALVGVWFLHIVVFAVVMKLCVSNAIADHPQASFILFENSRYVFSDEALWVWIILLYLFALFNWVLAYFRFKESEIIHRW